MATQKEGACIGCCSPCEGCSYNGTYNLYLVCDKCGCRADVLYIVENEELCRDCAIEECKEDIVDKYADEYLEDLESVSDPRD